MVSRSLDCVQLLFRDRVKVDVANKDGVNLLQLAYTAILPTDISKTMTKDIPPQANKEQESDEGASLNTVCILEERWRSETIF